MALRLKYDEIRTYLVEPDLKGLSGRSYKSESYSNHLYYLYCLHLGQCYIKT